MAIASPRLRRLDNALAHLPPECEAMMLSELDGYVAGLIVCPEPIDPIEWLPQVWRDDGEETLFEDQRDAAWYADLVLEHYQAVARSLAKPGGYTPFLEVDAQQQEILWELWIDGFDAAMALRLDSWGQIGASGDVAATEAVAGMITLAEIAHDESDLDRATIDDMTEAAPGLIPGWIATLYAWREAHRVPPEGVAAPPAKIGRNDPCPCGSGRKFKKCCGQG